MKQPLLKGLLNNKFYLQFLLQPFSVSADPGCKKRGFWAGLLVTDDCSVLSVLLCVSARNLLEALIECSVLGKVSGPHVKYMESRRF